ncbi:MAG: F0F1 ATP synthase subunit gamma [Alphaproteobacteria bacterium]
MTKRREIKAQLSLYDDLSGIIGAMRSFALVELRRVAQREAAQHQAMQAMKATLHDMAPALPPAPKTKDDIWLLFGSVRGFCGSFNEDVHSAWQTHGAIMPVIAVGEKLAALLPEEATVTTVPGAIGALDAAVTIEKILSSIAPLRAKENWGIMAVSRDENGVSVQRLLPLPAASDKASHPLPLTNEAAIDVARGVAEHYLFHSLSALLLRSISIENHMRLMQMENALSHLARETDELSRHSNRLRQEEIIEEIELIAGGKNAAATLVDDVF